MTSPNAADSFMARWQTVPRWALFGALVVVGAVSYLIYRGLSSSSNSSTQTWQTSANSYLTSQGYSASDASAATNAYANGQSLSPSQVSLIAAAIGAVGTPDVQPNSAVTAQLSNTPSTGPGLLGSASAGSEGNAGGGTTLPGSPYPGNSGTVGGSTNFWNVPVGSAGWSTTFNGIGGQFGVPATTVQQANPNLSKTLWGKIPQGSLVKVPRPATGE
jgi:hypothetical protein